MSVMIVFGAFVLISSGDSTIQNIYKIKCATIADYVSNASWTSPAHSFRMTNLLNKFKGSNCRILLTGILCDRCRHLLRQHGESQERRFRTGKAANAISYLSTRDGDVFCKIIFKNNFAWLSLKYLKTIKNRFDDFWF
jgi:hypothetical protein